VNALQNESLPILENPFFHRGAIHDCRYFFGRTQETRQALQMVHYDQCISIVGPRRIGKTSFLRHLCDPEVQEQHNLGDECLFVYIDCQGMGNLDEPQLYQWLWEETERALAECGKASVYESIGENVGMASGGKEGTFIHIPHHQYDIYSRYEFGLHQMLNQVGQDHPHYVEALVYQQRLIENIAQSRLLGDSEARRAERSEVVSRLNAFALSALGMSFSELCDSNSFSAGQKSPERLPSSFREFRDAVTGLREKGYKLTLLFDEFEDIAQNPSLTPDFFSGLRGLAPALIYATASQDSLFDLTYADGSVLSSPFFNVFSEIRLSFLKPRAAEEMIAGLLKMAGQDGLFSRNDLAFACDIGGYHPFFLQLACYRLFEQKAERQELTATDYDSVRQRYAEDTEAHFHFKWRKLTADEQEAARLACEGGVSQFSSEQRRRLERKCVLYRDTIFSSVFAELVRKMEKHEIGGTVE